RLAPQTDFLCGVSSYVVMFDKSYFSIVGTVSNAFSSNADNTFFNQTAIATTGAITSTGFTWPTSFDTDENSNVYNLIRVSNTVGIGSPNGGYPNLIPGSWLFSFKLKVIKAIDVGSNARIWMDRRWLKTTNSSPNNMYFQKCAAGQLSTAGSYDNNYDIDTLGADITLPLAPTSIITFNTNGGSTVYPMIGNIGANIKVPVQPTKSGYTFDGWDPALSATFPAANTTYTAKWKANQYSITFDSAGGSAVNTITQDYGTSVSAPAIPAKLGYTFVTWTPACPATIPASNTACVASWTANTYTVAYNGNGSDSGLTESSSHIYDTAKALTTNKFFKTGYTFTGWNTLADGSGTAYTNKQSVTNLATEGTATLYAMWSINSYTCLFDALGGVGGTSVTLTYGAPIVVPTITRAGYDFVGWDYPVPATMPANNLEFYAVYSALTYDAIFKVDGVEFAKVPTKTGENIVSPVPDPTKIGYIFTRWDPSVGAMIPGGATFNAVFTQQPLKLTVGGKYIDTFNADGTINNKYTVIVPFLASYKTASLQLGYKSTIENPISIVYSVDERNKNVLIDQNGKITNKGVWGRSAIITITIKYKLGDEEISAKDSAVVVFKKDSLDMLLLQIENLIPTIVKMIPIIKTVLSWFQKK
ncbi:MAG: InlB B-repeat-containing protein, partial [Eubacteriales bacterium]